MKRKIFIITLFLFIVGLMAGCNIGGFGGDDTGDDSQQRDIYDSATSDKKSYEEWLRSIKGSDGRDIELFVMDNTVVWRYVGDSVAIPLFSIESINGTNGINGINGTDGQDGREVAIRFFNNTLQWHYTDENEWNTLFDTNSLKGEPGDNGIGIRSIAKIKTEDLVDTYAITFTDGTLTTFTVTNGVKGGQGEKGDKGDKGDQGEQGVGIKSVNKISSEDLIDTYEIVFSDDTTTTFTIANGAAGEAGEKGNGIVKIELTDSPNAFLDIYTIYFEDETTFDFEVHHGEPLDQRMYTVTFDSDGGTEIEDQEVKFGYKAVAPDTPVKEGYKFLGWYIGDEKWSFIGYFITENINLVAKWELATYELNYEYNGGEEVEDATTEYTMLDDDIELPTPERFGYEFVGWCATEELINPTDVLPSGSTGNRTLYAKWQANTHTIKFESNGGTRYDDLEFGFGEEVELPTPERTGYGFVYWSTEENMQHEYKGSYEEDTDLTLYARWIVDGNAPYTVQVFLQNLDGTYSMKPYEELVYDDVPETTVSAPIGYYPGFNNPNYTPTGLVVSDGSLKLKLFYPRATYQISVSDGMGNWTYPQFKYGETITIADPEKVGYVFTGWNREVPETMPSYGFTIRATWQANLYKVTFDANGGDDIEMREYMYGQQYELPTPVFEGHEFAGWYYNGSKVEDGVWSYLKNITLVANWATVSDDFVFAQVEDHLEVISYNGNETEITIPTTADGMPVTAIADNAFNGNQSLTKVIMQEGITAVGEGAFSNMASLTEIVFPVSLRIIGSNVLTGTNVEKITLASNFNKQIRYLFGNNIANVPASLVKIKYANGCTDINKVMWNVDKVKNEGDPVVLELADDWTSVPASAFYGCNGLVSLIIPEGVQYIYDQAFQNCQYLEKVVLPTTLIQVYNYGFNNCIRLSDVNFEEALSLLRLDYQSFSDCDSLVEVTLPDNFDFLGMYALAWCNKLERVNFNNKIRTIDCYCLESCYKLKELVIPSSVTTISYRAFQYCNGLSVLIIPSSVTSVGEYILNECYGTTVLCALESAPNNWNSYWASNGPTVVWGHKETKVIDGIKYALTSSNEAYVLGAEDLTQTRYEFVDKVDGYDVVSVSLAGLFRNNTYVEEVVIPDFVDSIPNNAFNGATSLKKVIFGENSGVSSIGSYAFQNCDSLASIDIPNSVTNISNYAFYQCNGLRSVKIPDSITTLYDYTFAECRNLTVVILPNTITQMYYGAFGWNDSLQYVFYSGTEQERYAIPNNGNNRVFDLTWYYESNVQKVDAETRDNYSYLIADTGEVFGFTFINKEFEEFSFADIEDLGLTEISDYMFRDCTNLKSIYIPSTVTKIGRYAFQRCYNLQVVILPVEVTRIGYAAFTECNSLQYVFYSGTINDRNSIVNDGSNGNLTNRTWYYESSATSVEFVSNDVYSYIIDDNNVIYNFNFVDKSFEEFSFDLLEGVAFTTISDNMFYDCANLKSITIPASVTRIGMGAFSGCTALESVIFEDESQLVTIDSSAFYNCSSLTSIELPSGLETIGSSAFYNCSSLSSIIIPSSVTSIGSYPFSRTNMAIYCQTDEKPEGWNNYWNYNDWNGIWLTYAMGVKSFGSTEDFDYIVDNNDEVRITKMANAKASSVVLPDTVDNMPVTELGDRLFYDCDKLATITLPSGLKKIGNYTFYDCDKIKEIVLPDTLEEIGESAFYQCELLNTISGASSLTRVKRYAFQGCNRLNTFIGPNNIQYVGDYAFQDCYNWRNRFELLSIVEIGNGAFWGNYRIRTLILPDTLTSIGSSAFMYCDDLRMVYIPATVITMGSQVFNNNNIQFYCEVDSEPDDWEGTWNSTVNEPVWGVKFYTSDDGYVYSIKDNGNVKLISFKDKDAKMVTIESVDGYVIDEIGQYAFYNLYNLRKLFVKSTCTIAASYAISYYDYNSNRIEICFESNSRPSEFNGNYVSNSSYNEFFEYDFTHEIIELTFTSSDSTVVYDGYGHSPSGEITFTEGELPAGYRYETYWGDTFWEKGTYDAKFNINIYDENGISMTQYYLVNKVFGTFTIE